MRRREEDRDGGDDGEGGEGDEAEAVDHHGGELPVHDDLLLLVPDLHPVRDELELLQDALELAVGGGGAAVGVRRRGGGRRGRSARVGRRRWRHGRRGLDAHPHAAVLFQWVAVDADEASSSRAAARRSGHAHSVAASGHGHWPVFMGRKYDSVSYVLHLRWIGYD